MRCLSNAAWVRVLSKHSHNVFLKIRLLRQYYLHIKNKKYLKLVQRHIGYVYAYVC